MRDRTAICSGPWRRAKRLLAPEYDFAAEVLEQQNAWVPPRVRERRCRCEEDRE